MKKASFIFIFFVIIVAAKSGLANSKVLFWYPGEAGSSTEAQPILDEFINYLANKIPQLKLQATYFNTTKEGLNFIKQQKPLLGIISFSAWIENKGKISAAQPWLATRPFPSGKTEEKYILVKKMKSEFKPALILSSEPLSSDFILNHLQFETAKNIPAKATNQILFELKKIAEGKLNAYAILTPTEAYTFKKMDLPWTKEIKILEESKPVPTARVILFGTTSKHIDELKQTLLQIGADPAALEILDEMRLKGFAPINAQPETLQTSPQQ
ncbi:MAG: hypothetical protein ABH859_00595 [Pseudomonadota bacterium]